MSAAGVIALGTALLVDRCFGEPPLRLHPVAAMGRYLGALGPRLASMKPAAAFIGGAVAWSLGALAAAALGTALEHGARQMPAALAGLALGLLLKPLLAWRMLRDEVAAVEQALGTSLEVARAQLKRLVSRDVDTLDAEQVRESAIETLAENLNDSVVAPLFWFALGGLGAAALYRFANTADAMWGYRGRYEWAGKWAARADDVLSWLPARLTALLLCLAAARWPGLRAMRREALATPSPNGGWPMGAMALLLQVRLRKPGVYELHAGGLVPRPADARLALAWSQRAVWCAAAAGAALCLATP
jgi:adenosylcobinamide-phosphate synthase